MSELDGKDWETCMTMNGTWGYKSYDNKWKTPETLIHNLVDIASKGGNYLLNVGPDALGQFPQGSIDDLKAIGAWMKVNSESIYGTTASPLPSLTWGRCTKKVSGDKTILYLSVFNWPADGKLVIPGLKNKVISAKLLANGTVLKLQEEKEGLQVLLPAVAHDPIASVIRLEIKGEVANSSKTDGKIRSGSID
ncbi:MAG: alpha-L-fucosidase [Mucilaginibacter sp.]|nr:alpha-L-fucosidase [Mucilaginibacter sp.]